MTASPLSPDKPRLNPNTDDEFGHAPFAKMLAETIRSSSPPEGFVIALHGPWGSGKSTVLRFVQHYLAELDQSERPDVVEFNPWWFSGHQNLTLRFFEQLLSVLRKWKTKSGDLVRNVASFGVAVSEAPVPYASTAKIAAQLAKPRDIQKLKEQLTRELQKRGKRILVIADDIDRLTADEIRELFKVIKAVGDFPNMVYLLAFDKEMVTKALNSVQGIPGEEYLEKIVQMPFELPLPDRTSLRQFFFNRLNRIIASTPQEAFDHVHWTNVFMDGIDRLLDSPRDVVRLTNVLTITYPAAREEVNSVDFIAIEAIRVFDPRAYDLMRRNPEMFTGAYRYEQRDTLQAFHNAWAGELAERAPIKMLVRRIFPKLDSLWSTGSQHTGFEVTWRKSGRVCSPERFDAYFRLGVPHWDLSREQISRILAAGENRAEFAAELLRLADARRPDGITQLRAFLDAMPDYVGDVAPTHISEIVLAFADVGDQLIDQPQQMFDFGNEPRIGRVLWQLLKRLGANDRLALLSEAVTNGRAIATLVRWVIVLHQEHGRFGENQPPPASERSVDEDGIAQLDGQLLERIRGLAADDRLLEAGTQLPMILRYWKATATEEEVRLWFAGIASTDERVIPLVSTFLQTVYSQGLGDYAGRARPRLNPAWLRDFIDIDELAARLRALVAGVDGEQATALTQFLREYEMLKEGKDPDSPFSFVD